MNPAEILELATRMKVSVTLSTIPWKIRVNSKAPLPPALLILLEEFKAEILERLQNGCSHPESKTKDAT